MNDEYLLDKKGSDSISKFYKVFYILYIIGFVFMGIGLVMLITAGASIPALQQLIQNYQAEINESGVPYAFVEGFFELIQNSHVMVIIIFQYLCVIALYVYQFLYLRKARKMEKHFTEENAKQLLIVGLVTIIYPLVISIIFNALYANFTEALVSFLEPWSEADVPAQISRMTDLGSWGNGGSLTIGLALVLVSLYVRHGSKVIENNNRFNTPSEE